MKTPYIPQPGTRPERAIEALTKRGQMTAAELAPIMGIKARQVAGYLMLAVKRGAVIEGARGEHHLTYRLCREHQRLVKRHLAALALAEEARRYCRVRPVASVWEFAQRIGAAA